MDGMGTFSKGLSTWLTAAIWSVWPMWWNGNGGLE